MPTYLGMRIIAGALNYTLVVTTYPQFKDGVDEYLIANKRADLIGT